MRWHIHLGKQDYVELGNLNAKRDWGYANDYVDGMWRMLQAERPDAYVLATGRTEIVRDFVLIAFKAMGVEFRVSGEQEVGVVSVITECSLIPALSQGTSGVKVGQTVVRVNPKFYRPVEMDLLIGNAEKARCELCWQPKTTLEELCQMMVEADLHRAQRGVRSDG